MKLPKGRLLEETRIAKFPLSQQFKLLEESISTLSVWICGYVCKSINYICQEVHATCLKAKCLLHLTILKIRVLLSIVYTIISTNVNHYLPHDMANNTLSSLMRIVERESGSESSPSPRWEDSCNKKKTIAHQVGSSSLKTKPTTYLLLWTLKATIYLCPTTHRIYFAERV